MDEDGPDQKKSFNVIKNVKNSENIQKAQVYQEKQKEHVPQPKITPVSSAAENIEKPHFETNKKNTGNIQEKVSKRQNIPQKKVDIKDEALHNYKLKLQEEKKKKQEYKEHFKQMFEGVDDVFLLPHHNKKDQEFIIEESKD